MKTLISNSNINNLSEYDFIFILDENIWNSSNILAFIPNKEISGKGNQSICFIPFSYDNSWNYKNNARTTRYKLGNDNCLVVDTNITYQTHKKLNLSHDEEVDLVLLLIEFLQKHFQEVYINFIPKLSEIQTNYFNKLIEDKKIIILNE